MSKQFWIALAVIAVAFVGVILFSGKNDSNKAAGTPTNHVEGNLQSNVTLLEYGDYQCPACGHFYPTVKEVVNKYQDRIKFQFRNLPLPSLHPNAFAAARAAEAAGLQGKYFEMHDKLYENQNAWNSSDNPLSVFTQYAQQLGLNVDQFKADFASSKVNNAINADVAAFDKTKAETATPSFFLNGKQLPLEQLTDATGSPSVEAFSKVIDKALKAQPGNQSSQVQSSAPDSSSQDTANSD